MCHIQSSVYVCSHLYSKHNFKHKINYISCIIIFVWKLFSPLHTASAPLGHHRDQVWHPVLCSSFPLSIWHRLLLVVCSFCCCLVTKLYLTLLQPMDWSPTRLLCPSDFLGKKTECVVISFSRGSSQPKDQSRVSCIGRQILYHWASREAIFHTVVYICQRSSLNWSHPPLPRPCPWVPVFIAALFAIARTWKQPVFPSTDRWIKMWHIYTVEHSAIKRNKIGLFVVVWMNTESVRQSEVSQTQKNEYHILMHAYGIFEKWNS